MLTSATPSPAVTTPVTAPSARAATPAVPPLAPPAHGRWWFLAICFGWSWLSLAMASALHLPLSNVLAQLVTVAMVPALSAVVVRRWITREGFGDSGLRLRLRQCWSSYLIAFLVPVGVLVVGLLLAVATGRTEASRVGDAAGVVMTGPVLAVIATPLFWGEEYGWTAYLRDRLVPGRPVATTVLTGLIWGVWHFPLPWVGYFGGDDQPTGQLVRAMLLWLPLSVLLELLIGWLWARTGSIWPGALLHAGCNLGAAVGLEQVLQDTHGTTVTEQTCWYVLALVPFVLWVLARERRVRRSAQPSPA